MKTKNIRRISLIALTAMTLITTSCNRGKDPVEPVNAITLNMMNEQNGKTLLGKSDVYISKANNFFGRSSLIADCGKSSGLSLNIQPSIDNLAYEVAVIPGHYYQVFDKNTLREFPSGKRAVRMGSAYYKVFAESAIAEDGKTVGAVIKYVTAYPTEDKLPEWGTNMGDLHKTPEWKIEMPLPPGAECFFETHSSSGNKDAFEILTAGNKLVLKLLKSPNIVYGPYGTYNTYIRFGNVFSLVKVEVGTN